MNFHNSADRVIYLKITKNLCMCDLFCIFNMGNTNLTATTYGYYSFTIGRMVAVGSLGLPGAQEATAQTQAFILEIGHGRIRLGRVQQTQRPLMPYVPKKQPAEDKCPRRIAIRCAVPVQRLRCVPWNGTSSSSRIMSKGLSSIWTTSVVLPSLSMS